MSNKIFYINFNTGDLLDETGAILMTRPSISYQANPNWELHFVTVNDESGGINPVDVSQAVAWNAAIDTDFDSTTSPMVRTLPSGINSDYADEGIIIVPLDAGTETFYNKVNGKNTVPAFFEIRGKNAYDRVLYDFRFAMNALGAIDPNGGEPIPVVSGGVTMDDVYAVIRAAAEYRWSADGTNWHSTQQAADKYYQTRYPGGEWSETIELANGRDGYNVMFNYSADDENWHSTYQENDFYIRNSNNGGETWTSGMLFRGSNGRGFLLKGEYNDETIYNPPSGNAYEVVYYNGNSYAYINNTATSGNPPPEDAVEDEYWIEVAHKGDTGSAENVQANDVIGLSGFISGVVLDGWYDKVYINTRFGNLTSGDLYTKSEVDTKLAGKMNTSSAYTKTQVDNFLNQKASYNDVYSKIQTDTLINGITSGYVATSSYQQDQAVINNSIQNLMTDVNNKASKTIVQDLGTVTDGILMNISDGDYALAQMITNTTVTIGQGSFIGFAEGDAAALQITKPENCTVTFGDYMILDGTNVGTYVIGVVKIGGVIRITSPTQLM